MTAPVCQEFYGLLAEVRKSIPYLKILRPIAGSVTACILMQQLDYWFQKKPNGFYKFLDPAPKNSFYKPGASWTEELGFSLDEFRSAFDKIGTRYTSKTQYLAAREKGDPFCGLFYCSYHDKQKGLTVYLRNHSLLNEKLKALLRGDFVVDDEPQFTVDGNSQFTEAVVNGDSQFTGNGDSQFTGNGNSQSLLYTEITLHRVLTEEIKDPHNPPCGSDTPSNPEPRLSSLGVSKNSIDVDFWEEIIQDTLHSDSQNPASNAPEKNSQDLIVEYDTPGSLLGAFTQGKSDSNADTPNKTSLLLFSNPGVAIYSAPPETIPKKKKTKKSAGYSTGFHDIFWPIVAHKTNKPGALIKWAKTEGTDPWFVREAYMRQFEAHVKAGNDPKFFRRPEAWLHQLGWEDELPDPRLAEMRQKTPAEIREEQKQQEREQRKAETLRLIALRQQSSQV